MIHGRTVASRGATTKAGAESRVGNIVRKRSSNTTTARMPANQAYTLNRKKICLKWSGLFSKEVSIAKASVLLPDNLSSPGDLILSPACSFKQLCLAAHSFIAHPSKLTTWLLSVDPEIAHQLVRPQVHVYRHQPKPWKD